jgi:hypothetical protein
MRRFLALAGIAGSLALSAVAPAAAALSNSYLASGIETSIPTNNTSTFSGLAVGSQGDGALWKASVVHDPLSACPFDSGSSCAITGGTFSLTSSAGAVAGSFTEGAVTPISQQQPCGQQVYGVAGSLVTTNGAATFTGTLTHYRAFIFGRCITYFATISGSLQFG